MGVDAVLCLHGAHSNFYTPLFFDGLGEYLLPAGVAVLRVNTRGHDEVYTQMGKGRYGGGFEIVDDCRIDIEAWLDFLESRGYRNVLLWGHSLGAVKAAYYVTTGPDLRIDAAIASSPPRFNYAMELSRPDADQFTGPMQRAQELVAAGQRDAMVESLRPIRCLFTAGAYVDKYGPADRYDYLAHLPNVERPLLITVGGLETTYYYDDIRSRGPSISTELPRVSYNLIDGANHVYSDRVPQLWDAARNWLQGAIAPAEMR